MSDHHIIASSGNDERQPAMALCSGCAHEAADHDGIQPQEMLIEGFDGSCQQCGATLVGFFYRVPVGVEQGMSPGGGMAADHPGEAPTDD